MKASEFIFEDAQRQMADVGDIRQLLVDKCEPFLGKVNNRAGDYPLYRGVRIELPTGVGEFPTPVNRKPTDSSMKLHKMADDWFFEEFGIRFRSNAVFATGNNRDARSYGPAYQFVPTGEFKFCYSPVVRDLYNYFADSIDLTEIRSDEALEGYVRDLLYRARYSTTSSLLKGIASYHEIMFHCPSYILIDTVELNLTGADLNF